MPTNDLPGTLETKHEPARANIPPQNATAPENDTAADATPILDLRGYELMERLGGGGMGDVYRAVDPGLGRDLAVKVMKADLQGHPSAERRFLREARVTGCLQHPGIVPVYNLGRLADGRLHYTMRLVRGRTLADILKEEAGKPERWPALLAIFEKVCQAVAYAHSKHVIHRDLKPANVMVGRFGEVQVMDRGLAKVLTPSERDHEAGERDRVLVPIDGDRAEEAEIETRIHSESSEAPPELTRMGGAMGTPAYMPPEQALGEWDTVDERADVFALGALLCEMLTGRPPYRSGDGVEALQKAKRGDCAEALARLENCGADAALTALCRECLAPVREQRPRDAEVVAQKVAAYQSEVQERLRYAELERAAAQVKAREERKRRRWIGAALLVLAAGVAVSTWEAVRATKAEHQALENEGQALAAVEAEREATKLAQTRLSQVQKANERLASIFHDLDPRAEEKGGPSLRQQLSRHLEQAAAELNEAAIGDALAAARLQRALGASLINLGQAKPALDLLSKAAPALESQLGLEHPETLTCRANLAQANLIAGRPSEAIHLFEQTLKQSEAKRGPDHPDTLACRSNLANAYRSAGRTAEAIPLLEQTLKQSEAKSGFDHPATLTFRNSLAEAYRFAGRLDEAIRLQELALKQKEVKLGIDHPDTLNSRNNLANAYSTAGRSADAIRLHEQTLKQMEAKLGPDHPDTLTSRSSLAGAYRTAGRSTDAIRLYQQVLKQMEAKLGPDHPSTLTSRHNLAVTCMYAGRTTEAIPLLERVVKQRGTLFGPDQLNTLTAQSNLAEAYRLAGHLAESIRLNEQTLKQREPKLGPDHEKTLISMANLGNAYRDAGRPKEAIPLFEAALERGRKRSGGLPSSLSKVPSSLIQAYEQTGQLAKAESLCHDLYEQAERQFGPDDSRTAAAVAQLGDNLLAQKKFSEAEPLLRRWLNFCTAKRPNSWITFRARSVLGDVLLGQQKYAEAEPLLVQGYEGIKQRQNKIPPVYRQLRLNEALERLVRLYEATDQKEKAADLRKKLQVKTEPP